MTQRPNEHATSATNPAGFVVSPNLEETISQLTRGLNVHEQAYVADRLSQAVRKKLQTEAMVAKHAKYQMPS
jgi:hypothetical protein